MQRHALAVLAAVTLCACGKTPAASNASSTAPAETAATTTARSADQDAALKHALACAAAGVAQQRAMLAAAAKAGKSQIAGAMTASMWAKTAGDIVTAHGGSQADAQTAVSKAIDKAGADANAGKPDLDEAALEDCVKTATL